MLNNATTLNEVDPEMTAEPVVYILDDDASIREPLTWSIESINLKVRAFESGYEFLDAYEPTSPACLILDMRMPEIGGIEVLDQMQKRGIQIPVIVITAYGEVDMAVRAMQLGAVEFLKKPVSDHVILGHIQTAIQQDIVSFSERTELAEIRNRYADLTPREKDVYSLICHGQGNREIAAELNIAVKTSETHKGNLTRKMNANNLGDLIRMGIKLRLDK